MATKKKAAAKAAKKSIPAKKAVPAKKAAPKAAPAKTAKAAKPAPKAASKPVAKPAPKPAAKPAASKPAPAPAKSAPVPAKKAEVKPAVKTEAKAAVKAPASKTVSKPAAKEENKPEVKKAVTPKENKSVPAKKEEPKVAQVKKEEPKAAAEEKKPTPAPPPPAPKKVQAPPKPVVIPDMKTKTVKKYEPEFVKSVLDTPETTQTGPTMRYSDAELQEFRDLIQKKLDQAKKELAYLQGLITRKDEMGGDDSENRYMTMEDGSMSMEREQLAQMASRQINYIDHLEKAMIRIENKTYGICRVTGKLIDKARLRAVPHATLSIEAKTMMNK